MMSDAFVRRIMFVLVCFFAILVSLYTVSVRAGTGALHTEGRLIKDDSGAIVVLKGLNIPDPQHLNIKPQERPGVTALSVAKQAVEQLKAKVIRIPVLPGTSAASPDGWFSTKNGREKYFTTHLDPLVQYLTQNKVYAIIDLHYVSDYSGKWPAVQEFWTFMAPKYKDNPYVIYELFNEPINPDNWSTWKKEIAQPGVDLIRKYAQNLIIVGGPYWSSHMWGAATDPVVGANLAYTAHVYPNQTADKWQRNFEAVNLKYPLFVTEWGYELYNNPTTSTGTTSGFGVPFSKWLSDRSLSWCVWTLDYVWEPRMVDSAWKLKGGDAYMGEFVASLLAAQTQPQPIRLDLIKSGDVWKYLDNNTMPISWNQLSFNDSSWKQGASQLGYGDGDEKAKVSFGSSSSKKYVTTLFRKKVLLSTINGLESVTVSLLRDDGAVVYVNGVEVFRSNMPLGTITSSTLASIALDGEAERSFYATDIPKGVFVQGDNVVAVEVHQAAKDSSDISFDLQLSANVRP